MCANSNATIFRKPFVYCRIVRSVRHLYDAILPFSLAVSVCCLFALYISFSNRDDACQFWCSIKRFDYSKFLIITISTPLFCFRCFFCDKSLNIHMHSTSQHSSSQHTAKEFNSNLPLIYFSFKNTNRRWSRSFFFTNH